MLQGLCKLLKALLIYYLVIYELVPSRRPKIITQIIRLNQMSKYVQVCHILYSGA